MSVFHRHDPMEHRIGAVQRDLESIIEDIELSDRYQLEQIDEMIARFVAWWEERYPSHHHHHHPEPPPVTGEATNLVLTIKGANEMATFNIDDTAGEATLQFTGGTGNPIAGPNDSVTGAPIVPVVESDNTAVETVGAAVAGPTPGLFTYPLSEVAEGTANISVAALTNSDGSPVLETAGPNTGQPFSLPDPQAVTVTDTAEGLSLSVGDAPPAPAPAPAPEPAPVVDPNAPSA